MRREHHRLEIVVQIYSILPQRLLSALYVNGT